MIPWDSAKITVVSPASFRTTGISEVGCSWVTLLTSPLGFLHHAVLLADRKIFVETHIVSPCNLSSILHLEFLLHQCQPHDDVVCEQVTWTGLACFSGMGFYFFLRVSKQNIPEGHFSLFRQWERTAFKKSYHLVTHDHGFCLCLHW